MENTLIKALIKHDQSAVCLDAQGAPPNRKRENMSDHEVICTDVTIYVNILASMCC